MITYRQQQTFLMNRVDEQLTFAAQPMLQAIRHEADTSGVLVLQYGSYGELRDPDAHLIGRPLIMGEYGRPRPPPPELPDTVTTSRRSFGAPATNNGTHYRLFVT